jgi:hypothetical protein
MRAGENILGQLEKFKGSISPSGKGFDERSMRRLRRIDEAIEVEQATFQVHFDEPPTAAILAHLVAELDREARRVATSFERDVPLEKLQGRGTRLIPPDQGLVVEAATQGSLDLNVILGGIYQTFTGQPLSFVLNLASLLGYSRAAVRALIPAQQAHEDETERAVIVEVPIFYSSGRKKDEIRSRHARVVVPAGTNSSIRIRVQSYDGTGVEVELDE